MSRTIKPRIKTFDALQTERRCRKFMDNGGFEQYSKLSRVNQEAEISDLRDTELYKTVV